MSWGSGLCCAACAHALRWPRAGHQTYRASSVAPPPPRSTAGTALGYTSSALYLTSRLSQIARNAARRSVEGLAISMFLCACAANSLYGASILIRSYTWAELRSSLPWLIGSLGTVALDLTIFAQWRTLGRGAAQPPKERHSDEDEPLLAGREV